MPFQLGDEVWKKDKVTARLDGRSCQVQTPDQERYRRTRSREDQRSPNIHVDVQDITAFKNSEHATQSKPPPEAMQHHGNVNINGSTPAADTQDSHKTTAYQTTSILLKRQWAVLCRDAVLSKDKRCRAEFIYLYRFYVFVSVWLLGNLRIV